MALSFQEENELINLVREVARKEICPRFRRLSADTIRSKATFDDLVTEADIACENAITAAVRELLPGAAIIGEEAVAADPTVIDSIAGAEQAVIIDPVDGTWNFANGLATHGVLLAVTEGENTIFGLLYDPVMDDWVIARRGGGSWYCSPDSEPLRLQVSREKALEDMTGFASAFNFPIVRRSAASEALLGFSRAYSLRCACHEYRVLTHGQVDFMINASAKPWDHAAGALAVQEAGGAVGMLDGRDYSPLIKDGCILAANSQHALEAIRSHLRRHL
ncbi:inositol monophosphatase family protein [Marinobacterium sp. YM272]|uniref:inositol monophosphatase family protein n=1 Tax=Marinobacterium sp. YM272 TaxID=3421654 RepID=UPI003D7FCED0